MIDPRQRYDDTEALLRLALGAFQASVWTSMPAIVQNYNAAAQTVDVMIALKGAVQMQGGSTFAQQYPILYDVPVVWPRGGNCTLTFPIAVNDECLVVFAARAIDSWWQKGGYQNAPVECRMHDLSDSFAILGPFSQTTKLSGVSTSTTQLRSNDGEAYVELDGAGHLVNIVAPGGVNITGNVAVTGTLSATQDITSSTDVQTGTISLKNHVHAGVQSGGALTGAAQG